MSLSETVVPLTTEALYAILRNVVFPFVEDEVVSDVAVHGYAPPPPGAMIAFVPSNSTVNTTAHYALDIQQALQFGAPFSSPTGRQLRVAVVHPLSGNSTSEATVVYVLCTVTYSDRDTTRKLASLHLRYYSNVEVDAAEVAKLSTNDSKPYASLSELVAARSLPNPPKGSRRSLRIAILGAAGIAKKVFGAMEKAGHQIVAIGCRDLVRGQKFAEDCVASIVGGARSSPIVCSYQEAVELAEVQVVYIPLPVNFRPEWIEKCIALGKHVVCEKPPAANVGIMKNWVERLHQKKLLFVDGTMLSHGERVKRVFEAIHVQKVLGDVQHVHQNFTFMASPDDIRHDPKLEPMGALGDLGWYCVRYAQHLFGKPEAVLAASCQRNDKGGITDVFATLQLAGGVTQTFRVSFRSGVSMALQVSGTNGQLLLDDFCLTCLDNGKGTEYTIKKNYLVQEGCELNHHRVSETVHVKEESTFQETQMWRNIGHLVNDFSLPVATYWANMAMDTQETLDNILAKVSQ